MRIRDLPVVIALTQLPWLVWLFMKPPVPLLILVTIFTSILAVLYVILRVSADDRGTSPRKASTNNRQNQQKQDLIRYGLRRLVYAVNTENRHETVTAAGHIEFLLSEEHRAGEATTCHLYELIDDVLSLLTPHLEQFSYRLPVITEGSKILKVDPAEFKSALFQVLLQADSRCRTMLVVMNGDTGTQLRLTQDDTVRQTTTVPSTPMPESPPADTGLHALIVTDNPDDRMEFAQRLEAACVTVTRDPNTADLILVTDEASSNSLTLRTTHLPTLVVSQAIPTGHLQLLLPVTQATLINALGKVEALGAGRQNKLVLVVDDNESNRLLIMRQLSELGHDTVAASSAEEALEKLNGISVDLILMDIQMSGMSGVTATEEIRRLGIGVIVVGMTAHASSDEKQACFTAGMTDLLIKPVRLDNLRNILRYSSPQSSPRSVKGTELLPVFDYEAAVANANGDASLAGELLDLLTETLPGDIEDINVMTGSSKDLQRAVHKLHGAVRFTAVPRLRRAIEKLEVAIKQNDQQAVPMLINLLNAEADALLRWCRENPWSNQKSAKLTDTER